jgi:hypothetical protein
MSKPIDFVELRSGSSADIVLSDVWVTIDGVWIGNRI